jgi:hypothetical protein
MSQLRSPSSNRITSVSSTRSWNRISQQGRWRRRLARRWPGAYASLRIVALRAQGYKNVAHPFGMIDMRPLDINDVLTDELYWWYFEEAGRVVSGTWDVNPRSVSAHWKYVDLYEHFVNDMPWSSSEHFRRLILRGVSEVDALDRLTYYDRLKDAIHRDGFKMSSHNDKASFGEDICVCIGRTGTVLFSGSGWHRLSIARVLGLASIPVRVIWRHADWQAQRDAGTELDHPDLGSSYISRRHT